MKIIVDSPLGEAVTSGRTTAAERRKEHRQMHVDRRKSGDAT